MYAGHLGKTHQNITEVVRRCWA